MQTNLKSTVATSILRKLTPDKLLSWQNVLMNLTRFCDVTTLLLEIRVFWDTTLMTNVTTFRNVGNWWHSNTVSHLRRLE